MFHFTGFYLFVVGGEDDGRNRTELVTIDEAYPVPQCLKSLRDHTNELSFAAGGALSDRGDNLPNFPKVLTIIISDIYH